MRLAISSSLACCVRDAVWSAFSDPIPGVAVGKWRWERRRYLRSDPEVVAQQGQSVGFTESTVLLSLTDYLCKFSLNASIYAS